MYLYKARNLKAIRFLRYCIDVYINQGKRGLHTYIYIFPIVLLLISRSHFFFPSFFSSSSSHAAHVILQTCLCSIDIGFYVPFIRIFYRVAIVRF